MTAFRMPVTTEAELRTLIGGEPSPLALAKEQSRLDVHCCNFIARSPFVLVATSNAAGQCDVSPKGDAPGFVVVLDESRLVIPDRPGNKRLDGMRNLLQNPHVGLIFLIPGMEETCASTASAPSCATLTLLARCEVRGKVPTLGIGVEVEEAFIHCAKAFKRSGSGSRSAGPLSRAWPRRRACCSTTRARPARPSKSSTACSRTVIASGSTERWSGSGSTSAAPSPTWSPSTTPATSPWPSPPPRLVTLPRG